MPTYTKTFKIPSHPGREFRVRSSSRDWVCDVVARMAVIEVLQEGVWVDFMTIREPEEVHTIRTALKGS